MLLATFLSAQISQAQGSRVPERIIVEPAAVLSWDDLVRYDREVLPALGLPAPLPAPYNEPPPPQEVGAGRPAKLLPPPPSFFPTTCAGHGSEPAPSGDFQAIPDGALASFWIPPDTIGAVGPSRLMTMLNSVVRIQTRAGTTVSTVDLRSFWSSVGSSDVFDPKVYYDAANDRWFAVACRDRSVASSRVLFAMSDGSSPAGTWSFYSFDGDTGDTTWVDYPGVGSNATWIAITMNMFTNSGSGFDGVKMWVIDKSTALAGGPLTVTVFPTDFDLAGGFSAFTLQPCFTYDASEPDLYLVDNTGYTDSGTFLLRLSRITGSGASPSWSVVPGSSITDSGLFPVANDFQFTQIDAPQLGDPRLVETNDPRLLSAIFRNGHVWCTHSAGLPASGSVDRTAVFWYQLDPSSMPSPIAQSGVIDGGSGVHHSFPSIAANCGDDACVGFSRSDATRYAEAVYAMRLASDTAGTMNPVRLLKAGESFYYKTFGGSRNRWGDYSATLVDPVDDLTFWTIQEYAETRVGPADDHSRWGTWWGRIGSCGEPDILTQPMSRNACTGEQVMLSVSAVASVAPLAYQWRKDGIDLDNKTSSTLNLGAADLSEAGTYDVVIHDGCGTATSDPAVLTVDDEVVILSAPASRHACVDQRVELEVVATGTDLAYQWRKNGSDIGGANASTLVYDPVALGDSGSYEVIVSNPCSSETRSATLEVHLQPCKAEVGSGPSG